MIRHLLKRNLQIDGDALLCPACGEPYLHHGCIMVSNRDAEDQPGFCVTVARAGVSMQPTEAFEGRRDDISIAFDCEHCGSNVATLHVVQHKGFTLIYWSRDTVEKGEA